jgi:hypothetical protein
MTAHGGHVDPEKECKKPQKIQVVQHSFTGGLWLAAWLFTIGFLKLTFWRGVFAIVIWPYYLGVHFTQR